LEPGDQPVHVDEQPDEAVGTDAAPVESEQEQEPRVEAAPAEEGEARKGRRRPRARRKDAAEGSPVDAVDAPLMVEAAPAAMPETEAVAESAPVGDDAPAKPRRGRRKAAAETVAPTDAEPTAPTPVAANDEAAVAKPARRRRAKAAPALDAAEASTVAEPLPEAAAESPAASPPPAPEGPVLERFPAREEAPVTADVGGQRDAGSGDETDESESDGTPRRGWWQRTFGA
jgi:ribonuclease E